MIELTFKEENSRGFWPVITVTVHDERSMEFWGALEGFLRAAGVWYLWEDRYEYAIDEDFCNIDAHRNMSDVTLPNKDVANCDELGSVNREAEFYATDLGIAIALLRNLVRDNQMPCASCGAPNGRVYWKSHTEAVGFLRRGGWEQNTTSKSTNSQLAGDGDCQPEQVVSALKEVNVCGPDDTLFECRVLAAAVRELSRDGYFDTPRVKAIAKAVLEME